MRPINVIHLPPDRLRTHDPKPFISRYWWSYLRMALCILLGLWIAVVVFGVDSVPVTKRRMLDALNQQAQQQMINRAAENSKRINRLMPNDDTPAPAPSRLDDLERRVNDLESK